MKSLKIGKHVFFLLSVAVMVFFMFFGLASYVKGDYRGSLLLIGLGFLSLFPFGYMEFRKLRGEWKYNNDMIKFLEDLAGYANTGMPLREALISVAKSRYGAFDYVVRKIELMLNLNMSVEEVIRRAFSDERYRFNKIVSTLLVEANRVGGDIGMTLQMLADSFNALMVAKRQQQAAVSSYMIVAIIGFGVYLFTIGLIFVMLFPSFAKLGVSGISSGLGAGISMSFNMLPQFEFFVFLSVIVLGFFTGLVSSSLKDNSYYSGFFYGGIFVLVSLIMQVIVWGV